MNIRVQSTPDYFHAVLSGKFHSEVVQKQFSYLLYRCKQEGKAAILVDMTDVEGKISATDKIFAGMAGADSYQKYFKAHEKEFKIAVIVTKTYLEQNSPPYTPGIEALRDAGINTLVTHDRSTALEWILKKKSEY